MELMGAIKKTRSGRLSNPPPENYLSDTLLPQPAAKRTRKKKTTKKSLAARGPEVAEIEEEVAPYIYDDFYDKLERVRVPPSTYDTSDFDNTFLFHIRMSNYLIQGCKYVKVKKDRQPKNIVGLKSKSKRKLRNSLYVTFLRI